jgi:hypothetical protein
LAKVPGVENTFLHGESLHNFCVVVVVPTKVAAADIAKSINIQESNKKKKKKNLILLDSILF